tara:strand:- start:289 stop:807 length:519 start_codon:yes stop_codon:yes gene_type:complete
MPRLIDTSLIKKFEGCPTGFYKKIKNEHGIEESRYVDDGLCHAYLCPAKVWTIAHGSTYLLNGARVNSNSVVNLEQADMMLEKHIQTEIIDRLDEQLLNSLTDKQLSALCSLIYRIGITKFNRSKLKKAILKQDYKLINNNWDWLGKNKAIHRGLCLRVSEEKAVFFSDKFK